MNLLSPTSLLWRSIRCNKSGSLIYFVIFPSVNSIAITFFALAFNNIMFCNFGWYSTASRNHSAIRWLLLCIVYVIFSPSGLCTLELYERSCPFGYSSYGLGCPHALFSSFWNLSCSFLLISINVLFLNQNTWKSRIYISYLNNICVWVH